MSESMSLSEARSRAAAILEREGIALTEQERGAIEIADFGLGDLERTGLEIVIYVNTDRYCAKELILFPRQTCPQHRHPPVGADPGKEETFRCRRGLVWLYVEGDPTPISRRGRQRAARTTIRSSTKSRCFPAISTRSPPNTLHWFQAADEGAIVSEFSSTSRDEFDIFTDPRIVRVPKAE